MRIKKACDLVSPRWWPARVANKVDELKRQRRARETSASLPAVLSIEGSEKLEKSILGRNASWQGQTVPPCTIPGAISDEEKQYYVYMGRFYSGQGKVIELGPWLGCSTCHIVAGLRTNPRFQDQKLYVFDDFIWRSLWMDAAYRTAQKAGAQQQRHGESFRSTFDRYTEEFAQFLVVEARRFSLEAGNKGVPPLVWEHGPIELCYVDCGRTYEVNQAWYDILRDSFIPDKTLLILQDWQTHKEVPVAAYNQMKAFTDSKGAELELVHELRSGSVGTFLYRGRSG